jgi:hypothetical protein
MVPPVKKHIEVERLKNDLARAEVELLSAQCAAERVRLRYSPEDIVTFGERQALKRALASVQALPRFFSEIEAHIKPEDEAELGYK